MGYRIAGALTAIVAGILLVWVVFQTFEPEGDLVEPEVRWVAGAEQGQDEGLLPREVLRQRTELQRWRAVSGPAPGEQVPPAAFSREEFQTEEGVPVPRELVRSWRSDVEDVASILRESEQVGGVVSVPYYFSQFFEDPVSRDFRQRHNEVLSHAGGWIILGAIFVFGAFLAFRGRVRIKMGKSGEKVPRFTAFERANHWMTASSFVLMGLTGLVILYGKPLLIPLIGVDANSQLAWWSAWLHMGFAIPFVLGILIMAVMWFRQNLFTRADWLWLKVGGGIVTEAEPPPTPKNNAGEKITFWIVVPFGLLLAASGVVLMFPFSWLGLDGMQWTQLVHAGLALIMIAVIIGHIYIGTVGMEGAFWGMWDGHVDRNWAREHHSLWYRELMGVPKEEIEYEKRHPQRYPKTMEGPHPAE